MCVDAGVTSRACEVFVFPVGYVLVRPTIPVLLSQAKVYDIHEVTFLAQTHQEVVGLDVAVYEVLRVYVLYAAYLPVREAVSKDKADAIQALRESLGELE